MKKLFLSLALGLLLAFGVNAQNADNKKGDWYVGTGDISGIAWTDWAISPSLGYAVTDNVVCGLNLHQEVGGDEYLDLYARYYLGVYYVHVGVNEFNFNNAEIGYGMLFMINKNVYVDPCFVYNAGDETSNLQLRFGFKF